MNEFTRRENGSGTVVFLGKGRYKPWVARLEAGKDENAKPIWLDIDTFENKLDALVCLENWLKNPYPLKILKTKYDRIIIFTCFPKTTTPYPLVPVENKKSMIHRKDKKHYTFKQVFEEMREALFPTAEERKKEREFHIKPGGGKYALHNSNNMITAFNNSVGLHDKIYSELVTSDFRDYIFNSGKNEGSMKSMIKLYKNMDKYAFSEKIISVKYAAELEYVSNDDYISNNPPRAPFTYEQIKYLWNIHSETKEEELVRDILLLANYSGARAEELCFIYIKNIHLDENYFVGGLKTENGINREIPIHPLVKPIFEHYYDVKNQFLFMKENGKRLFYSDYNNYYQKFIEKHPFLLGKTAHCGRHGLETELKKLNVKSTIINSILGHKNGNVGDDVYNDITIEEKLEAIKLVTYKPKKIYVLNTKTS